MRKRKIMFISVMLIILALAIVGLSLSLTSKEKTRNVKIGYLPIMASLPLYVAQENNYFTEQGIQIETVQLQSSNQLVDALVRGDIDIVVESSAVPALIAETVDPGKIKIFSVSDITEGNPFDSLIIGEESNLESLKELEGKKIGVFPGSTATNLLKKFLSDKKVDISKIEFVQIIPSNQLPALYEENFEKLVFK
ncbi:MAG: ABC transporter substrate-binding protein [Nanoarchaeota archaeon]